MDNSTESLIRSLIKTITWRVVVLLVDFSIAYFFTKDFVLSSQLAIAKFMVASMLYFVHERTWNKISWGRILTSKN